MLKNTLKYVNKAGEYTQYLGLGLIFTMAVVGTIAIDLVIFAAMMKAARESNRRGQNNPFITMMLWNMMFNRSLSHPGTRHNNFGLELLLAPVTTIIAIVLAVCLGVPEIAVALVAGWVVALGILAVGYLVEQTAESVIKYLESAPETTEHTQSDIRSSYQQNRDLEARQEAEMAQARRPVNSSNTGNSNPPPYNTVFFQNQNQKSESESESDPEGSTVIFSRLKTSGYRCKNELTCKF